MIVDTHKLKENGYLGNPNVKRDGVDIAFTSEQVTEYIKCSIDPIYFCENYLKVIHLDHGLVKFKLYPYQKEMFKKYNGGRFSITLACRQSGKSASTCAYLLWYALFHSDKTVAILANKGATAREMLSRITLMLENLPFFLQPGCKALNKGNIDFSNNSRIISAATSSSSIRGLSISCITGDSYICVSENDSIYYRKIDNFINKSKLIEKDMIYTIYKITNKINGKIYIGYHGTYNLDDGYMGSGKLIRRAIEKYGIENFTKEILSTHTTKEAAEAEEKRIVDRDFTLREDTYNLSLGGNICVLHGQNNGFFGKTHSEETRKKISEKRLGCRQSNSNKIQHVDGRIFHNVKDAISQLLKFDDNKYANRSKIIYECGRPNSDIWYVEEDIQKAAEEFYIKRNKEIAEYPQRKLDNAKKRSQQTKGIPKPEGFGKKISIALSGYKKTADHIRKINNNPEKIRKTAEAHRGTKRTDESKHKMSIAKKGKSAKNKGKKYYTNPEKPNERGYYAPGHEPLGWINQVKL